jgi:hypothetical protein
VQDLGSIFGFWTFTISLHVHGGDLCIYVDLLIGRLFFVMFHTSQRECKSLKKNVIYFGNLRKNCTMSNICTAFLQFVMIVWYNGVLNFFSLHALRSWEDWTQFNKIFLFFNNHINYTKRGLSFAYIFYSIVKKIIIILRYLLLHNVFLSQFLVIRSLWNRPTRPESRNNYPQL